MKANEDNIAVFLRIRPPNAAQLKEPPSPFITSLTPTSLQVHDPQKSAEHQFTFDQVFDGAKTQSDIYEKVGRKVVQCAFQGFNGTLFAYGQTSSGKTHTCIGPDYQDNSRGILPRLISHIFDNISQSPSYIQFRIKLSMVQIYQQKIKDLLDPTKTDLKIRQNRSKGIYLQDVTEEYVASPPQAFKLLKKGIAGRSIGSTNMNDVSSRSHMTFLITVYQNNLKDASAKSGKIIVVDLAGSEKVSKSGAEGKLLDEAKMINKSLSALGNVINALTDVKTSHIPYRDSKLTRLLQESLGGNSKTHLIITLSPAACNAQQSISSLRFGFRAKQIKNKPKVNKEYTVAELLLLLQKSQKKVAQLQMMVKQLTVSASKRKSKKQKQYVMENLLDSDNILSALSDQEEDEKPSFMKKSLLKNTIQLKFQSQCNSDEEKDMQRDNQTPKNTSPSRENRSPIAAELQQKIRAFQQQIVAKNEELHAALSELQDVSTEKVKISRELDITMEKNELIMKEMRLANHKQASLAKENQSLLQRLIKESMQNQQKHEQITALKEKLEEYEHDFIGLAKMQENIEKMGGVGLGKEIGEEMQKIVSKVEGKADKKQKQKQEEMQHKSDRQIINELQMKVKSLEQEMALMTHLQASKQALIKERLSFTAERQRIYKDLQNRIEKVLYLEEKLDQQKQKRKYYQQLIETEESEKGRRIIVLQRQLAQASQNYYVLKGMQSSWQGNTKRVQQIPSIIYRFKLEQRTKRVQELEEQVMELKIQIENLKNICFEMETQIQIHQSEESSQMELDFGNQNQGKAKIVKVIRSDLFD